MQALLPLAFVNSPWSWIVILLILLLLFGSRLPHAARNMGRGINEFKKGLREGTGEPLEDGSDEEEDAADAKAPTRRKASSGAGPSRGGEIDDTSV